MKRTIYINQDNHHFYGCHPPEDMTVEGIQRLVDFYAEDTQVKGILFCVNVQRALFDSKTWETFWSDYDPNAGDDQPCLKRGHGVKNHLLLRERNLDQFSIWLERCKHYDIEGWLTMRMNDCHGLGEYAQKEAGTAEIDDWTVHWPSTYWREHPELRRAPYRMERSWEGAFDYAKQEIRDHHLRLVKEILERYDMFGLELDWMRWGMNFAPGEEYKGREILTEFIRQVRHYVDSAEKRWGHPIELAHRIPAHPESCLELGYDVITWVKEGFADMIILSSMLGGANFQYPMEIWRCMLGDQIKILTHAETVAQPYPSQSAISYEFLYGSAASALQRGSDGIYLFNECYRESDAPELLKHVMTHAGELETLQQVNRRHAVTFPQVHAAGEPSRNRLPIPLRQPKDGTDFGRMEENISLRITVGRKPDKGQAVLRLGFSADVPDTAISEKIEVRLNTHCVKSCSAPQYQSVAAEVTKSHNWTNNVPESVGPMLYFDLPLEHLHDDINVIEFIPPQIDGTLEWAEIIVVNV